MNVLVDTSVWSLALRRETRVSTAITRELVELIREGRAVLTGPVRQELLSGVKKGSHFERLRDSLRAFHDETLAVMDYELAAEMFNRCRARGVQGSNTDFLLCSIAERRGLAIFTTDRDFEHCSRVVHVRLHAPR